MFQNTYLSRFSEYTSSHQNSNELYCEEVNELSNSQYRLIDITNYILTNDGKIVLGPKMTNLK